MALMASVTRSTGRSRLRSAKAEESTQYSVATPKTTNGRHGQLVEVQQQRLTGVCFCHQATCVYSPGDRCATRLLPLWEGRTRPYSKMQYGFGVQESQAAGTQGQST